MFNITTKEDIKNRKSKEMHIWYIYIIAILIISLFLRFFVYTNFLVNGESMYPTYSDKDIVFSTKLSDINRFDIIVFRDDTTGKNLIKRVVGFGSETIAYINDELYINGEVIEEPYKSKLGSYGYTKDFNTTMLYRDKMQDNCYFVLGDNRNNSKDSRDTTVGCVAPDKIQGIVKLKLWGNF